MNCNAVEVLTQCLKAVAIWMGNKKLWLNPGKTEWFCDLGMFGIWAFTIFGAGWVAVLQIYSVHNLGILLN